MSSSSQSSQSTNLHASSLASSGGDHVDTPKNAGTYPFTQSSITSSQTNNDDAEVDPPSASPQKTTTNTSSSSSINIRKSSRQVTPSSKRSHQLNTYNEQMFKSKQKRQKTSVVKTKANKKSFQTTMTQCVPFHVDTSHQSTPTQPTTKDTKVAIMKHASGHKKHNRIFVGASVYSRSVGTELEPLQPGKKKRLRKAMYGKVVESMDNNTYKVLFSNNTYHILKSSQLTRAPDDPVFSTNLQSATASDIEDVYEKVENSNDVSIIDAFDENVENEVDYDQSTLEFDIHHSSSDDDTDNSSDEDSDDDNMSAAPTTSEQYRIDGGPILIMDENNKPLHYLCSDGSKLSIANSHNASGDQQPVLDKYQIKKIEGRKELDSYIGDIFQVTAGKSKSAERIEWEVIKEHIPSIPKRVREKNVLGLRDKEFLKHIKHSDNPVAELFLYLLYGGKDKWIQHRSTLNEKITSHNNSVKAKSKKDKRYIKPFEHKEFLTGHALLIGAADCNQRGNQLWHNNKSNINSSSWTSIANTTDFSQWMSSFRFKQFKQFIHQTWECNELNSQEDPWWKIQEAINTFNNIRQESIQTSEIRTVDETMSAFRPQTRKTGDLPHLSFIARKPEPLGTEFKSCACPMLKIMTHLEICRGKNEKRTPKYKDEMGATAACTCRMAESVCQTDYDGIREIIMGDSWFGSVKTASEMSKRGKEGIFQVKIAKRLFPKEKLEELLKDKAGGSQVVMKGKHPATGVNLIAVGYKYNSKTTLCFVCTENAGTTAPGTPYEMKYTDTNGNICIREVERPSIISNFFHNVNTIDVLNHLRQFCLKLEKKWVTQSGYFRIHTTLTGINVVDTMMLCIHHGLLQQQSHGIQVKTFLQKCNTDQKEQDDEDITKYSMTTFAGILARQLLNLANDCDKKERSVRRMSINEHPSEINCIQRCNSLSSVSVSSSYCSMQNTNRIDNKGNDSDEDCFEERRVHEKTVVAYCDVMGNMHNGVKLNKKQQKTNGKCYTPTMKCAYPGCKKSTRVMCYQCHAPFCYPLKDRKGDETDICFVKHVDCIKK